jgi:8-oxo-dGTP diphosphatase
MPFSYEYPRPAVTVDCVIFGYGGDHDSLNVLLIERKAPPFVGQWALPGGFIHMTETLDQAARRELQEETGVEPAFLEQLYTFGGIGRDPRGRTITVAYYALVRSLDHNPAGGTDARQAAWFSIDDLPQLAFDHHDIFDAALERLRGKVRYAPIGFGLLPKKFTLYELQHLYETILETDLDKRNFRRKVKDTGLLIDTGEVQQNVPHRAARFYSFDEARYRELEKQGHDFEL